MDDTKITADQEIRLRLLEALSDLDEAMDAYDWVVSGTDPADLVAEFDPDKPAQPVEPQLGHASIDPQFLVEMAPVSTVRPVEPPVFHDLQAEAVPAVTPPVEWRWDLQPRDEQPAEAAHAVADLVVDDPKPVEPIEDTDRPFVEVTEKQA